MSLISPVPAATATAFAAVFHGVRADLANSDYVRRWGQAGGLSISQAAVKAERRLRLSFARAPEPDEPAAPQEAARAPIDILRNAALSLVAQANIDRQGAVRLLLG